MTGSNVVRRRSFSSVESASHGAAFHRALEAIGVDVERLRRSFHNFARDRDFLDTLEARELEHGLEQDALEDRPQAARPGLALDRLAGDRAKRLVDEGQLDILRLEQPLILLETKFDLPGLEGVEKSSSRAKWSREPRPLYIYADSSGGKQRHGVLTRPN